MSRPWSVSDYYRDASDQTAEHADAMAAEARADRDDYLAKHGDDRPTRAELAADEDFWLGRDRDAEWWSGAPDPWGDVGPVHHPTRFDLPVSAEPPF